MYGQSRANRIQLNRIRNGKRPGWPVYGVPQMKRIPQEEWELAGLPLLGSDSPRIRRKKMFKAVEQFLPGLVRVRNWAYQEAECEVTVEYIKFPDTGLVWE